MRPDYPVMADVAVFDRYELKTPGTKEQDGHRIQFAENQIVLGFSQDF